jgi:hypothetical protein
MKIIFYLLIFTILLGCSRVKNPNPKEYFKLINKAELAICSNSFEQALNQYEIAFNMIEKPFGKDVFNAALSSQLQGEYSRRNSFLLQIMNNLDNLYYVKSDFVPNYMTEDEWKILFDLRKAKYNPSLRAEFNEILNRDQLHRPNYNTHDAIINTNRIYNLNRIIEVNNSSGFPSHIELGYSEDLKSQPHHIVLHHTAQRRSNNKSIYDLENLLLNAVNYGKLDPEIAIFYMNFQNDIDKGMFEVYSTWQFNHHLLPDSLNSKIWLTNLSNEEILKANEMRMKWNANTLQDIAIKTAFISTSNLPFKFTCGNKSIGNLRNDFNKDNALSQYKMITNHMMEYKNY